MTREEATGKIEQALDLVREVREQFTDEFGAAGSGERRSCPSGGNPTHLMLDMVLDDLDDLTRLLNAKTLGDYLTTMLATIMARDLRAKMRDVQMK